MKLAIVQSDIVWEDKYKNFEILGKIIERVPSDTDIVILPEMFNTGFSMDPVKLSETPGSATTEWLKSISENKNFGICGSYIIKKANHYFNRWVFLSPANEIQTYDKRHLFSPGNENNLFTPGRERVVFSFRGFRICPIICYDLRFPVWCRNRNDYDLLVNSANWPESRKEVWFTLLKARAIENQCYVAGANRIGIDGKGIKYSGDSLILNPRGEIIASAAENSEGLVSVDISLPELQSFREKFPVLKDADKFSIKF